MLLKTNGLVKWSCIGFALLLLASSAFAQKTVSGKVLNNTDKQPLVAASVVVKGTSSGTTTAEDGSFSISVPSDRSVLVISATGFGATEVSVEGKTSVGDIALTGTSVNMDEVI